MNSTQAKGRFVWHELLTKDPAGAKAFYPHITAWGTKVWEDGPMPYTMFAVGDRSIAGVMQLPAEAAAMGAPSFWLGHICTPDVNATLAHAVELGAKVLKPVMTIPTVGSFAIIHDPQGAVVSFYQPEGETGEPSNGPGFVCWNEHYTTDLEASWSFYSTLFGWEIKQDMDMGPMGVYRMFGIGDHRIGGMCARPPMMPVSTFAFYFEVPSIAEGIAAVTSHGGQVVNGPMDVPGGSMAQCVDPQGAFFALHTAKHA